MHTARKLSRRAKLLGGLVVLIFVSLLFPTRFEQLSLLSTQPFTSAQQDDMLITEDPFLPSNSSSWSQFKVDYCSEAEHKNNSKPGAIATMLSSDQYIRGAQVLGYSLRVVNTTVPMLLLHQAGTLSEETLCKARAVGWTPVVIEHLENPKGANQPPLQYKDQFTKLRAWQLLNYSNILMIDSDAYVRHPVDQVFCLDVPFAFADTFFDGYNNGVSYLRPSQKTFTSMVGAMQDTTKYTMYFAEQAFLYYYYVQMQREHIRLPHGWNVDLNLYLTRSNWKELWDERVIVHFTLDKPWTVREREPNSPDRRPWDEWYSIERQFLRDARFNGTLCGAQ
ncbi:hypothetical protein RI367_002523 [Sorochytrium milnesiophthora]